MSTSESSSAVSKSNGVRDYKVVILGDGGVGKSALVIQFVCHRFLEYHDPTIEDSYQQQARIDGEPAKLDILDTAGQPEFNAMREQYMRKGEGFIICYSITDRRSFDEVLTYKKLINRVRCREDIPIVIAGNKCDLEEKRKVSVEEGMALARQLECPFFETSAVLRKCVDDVFHKLVQEIRRKELDAWELENKSTRKLKGFRRLGAVLGRLNVFKKGSRSHNT
ncbi:GTP-binding protein Rit2-like [Mizuhopecten yessoensis]|uniref:small monomeric GTPase n=1 Tax=Mizuhopecten yessoensis TaxID=6573 RepID=A0A210QG58_MIZYE|nr:GTP-binding protein Rit2-like [Mizuhopecten yessoensis]OWF47730.1 GTP-binding protein Rit2 [Mizuhopecten yessoensis]